MFVSNCTFKELMFSCILLATEVEDTHHRVAFLDGGAILNLPIFYLEGTNLYGFTFDH